nr:hypothetical protein [Tanacetum cinerariifolium]
MVDIPNDEDLVDHDGDDEEPKEEPKQQIGHGNYDAPEGYYDCFEHLQAPGLHVPPTVIEDSSTRLGNLEYRHGVLIKKMEEVQVMESQAVQVVSGLKEIETRVQKVESRVETYSSGQMA